MHSVKVDYVCGLIGQLPRHAGGRLQELSHRRARRDDGRLGGRALAARERAALLIGRDAGLIEAALAESCEISLAGTLDDAVATAARVATRGDTVLLSPACASFDMFRDYAHRGEVFAAAVRSLPQ